MFRPIPSYYSAEDMHRDWLESRRQRAAERTPVAFRGPFEPRGERQSVLARYARLWVEDFTSSARGLYLHSAAPGTGKSHLAYRIAAAVDGMGHEVVRWNVASLLDAIRANYHLSEGEWDNGCVPIACDADLLLLDDLGVERSNAWVNEQLYRIVNSRYEAQKPIIVTANFTGAQQVAHMGGGEDAKRIISRLSGMTDPWSFEGIEDQRKRVPQVPLHAAQIAPESTISPSPVSEEGKTR